MSQAYCIRQLRKWDDSVAEIVHRVRVSRNTARNRLTKSSYRHPKLP